MPVSALQLRNRARLARDCIQFANGRLLALGLEGPAEPVAQAPKRCEVGLLRPRRLLVKPGLTGLWQVLGRTNIPFEEMVKLDYMYVTNWSLWEDVRLMLRTLPTVITRRGAN